MPAELDEVAARLRRGEAVAPVTVRDVLSWFDAKRRGYLIVELMRDAFEAQNLRTIPDFESVWVDEDIVFVLDNPPAPQAIGNLVPAEVAPVAPAASTEATLRVRMLDAANQGIASIGLDGTIEEAVTLMMAGDYSQLPVMSGPRQVHGILTWKALATRMALGARAETARQVMMPHREVRADAPLFDAIPDILDDGYVLVRSLHNVIVGIVTATDLSVQFRDLSEPFLLISEIETLIRSFFIGRLAALDMPDPQPAAADHADGETLSFGDYVRLLQNPERWHELGMRIDRRVFCERLDQVRRIRNDVMHFRPDPLDAGSMHCLRSFTAFLRDLEGIPLA